MVVKQVLKTLGPVITHIINLSLGLATFPPKWKISRILPLLKSSDAPKELPASYRPVAQLPLVAKLTERIVQKQLLDYLENSNLLAPDHHAYRRRHSTTTALVQLMDTISTAADANQITATLSMDLSAAFDCVDHGILLDKLGYYGLDSQTLSWIKSYLRRLSSLSFLLFCLFCLFCLFVFLSFCLFSLQTDFFTPSPPSSPFSSSNHLQLFVSLRYRKRRGGGGEGRPWVFCCDAFFCSLFLFFFIFIVFFAFLSFCLFVARVQIYYHTNFCSNPTIFQFYHTFYHTLPSVGYFFLLFFFFNFFLLFYFFLLFFYTFFTFFYFF